MKEVSLGTICIEKAGEGTMFLCAENVIEDVALIIHDPMTKTTALARNTDIEQLQNIISTSFKDYAERKNAQNCLRIGFLGGNGTEESRNQIKAYINFIKEMNQDKELFLVSDSMINSKWKGSGFLINVETGEVKVIIEKKGLDNEQHKQDVIQSLDKALDKVFIHDEKSREQEKQAKDITPLNMEEKQNSLSLYEWRNKRKSPYPTEDVLSRIMPGLESKRPKLSVVDEAKLTVNFTQAAQAAGMSIENKADLCNIIKMYLEQNKHIMTQNLGIRGK